MAPPSSHDKYGPRLTRNQARGGGNDSNAASPAPGAGYGDDATLVSKLLLTQATICRGETHSSSWLFVTGTSGTTLPHSVNLFPLQQTRAHTLALILRESVPMKANVNACTPTSSHTLSYKWLSLTLPHGVNLFPLQQTRAHTLILRESVPMKANVNAFTPTSSHTLSHKWLSLTLPHGVSLFP